MTTEWLHARRAYDGLASHYDGLTADYDHQTWLRRLLQLVGHPGPRVLDVACGTGKSFAPLVRQGCEISACDISCAMLEIARERLDLGARRVFAADMRDLPACGLFDLITCLDDAVNYLRSPAELFLAFRSVARLLGRDGVFVFDANTLLTYRTAFAGSSETLLGAERFRWRGLAGACATPGVQAAAVVERVMPDSLKTVATHQQRHHPIGEIVALLSAAGLVADAIVGQSTGCRLDRRADELRNTKTVFVARLDLDSREFPRR
ncbi:MAG: methyltransferase domain-containing protein [Actinomycetota bacterium]|nr:methyltransferase domain-containing protein [Actinomycetota bacterium]